MYKVKIIEQDTSETLEKSSSHDLGGGEKIVQKASQNLAEWLNEMGDKIKVISIVPGYSHTPITRGYYGPISFVVVYKQKK